MAPSTSTEPPIVGSCAGFEIHADLPFATLRVGGGTPLTVVEEDGPPPGGEVVARWSPRPGNPFHGHLLRDGAAFAFWASDAGWYRIRPDEPVIAVDPGGDPLRRELRLFGIPAAVCAHIAGDLSLHASAVDIDGRGVLLAAPSMHGKTTLAAAFAADGHRLLAEDTVRCSLAGAPRVHPGPAIVRLREDMARAMDIPAARALPSLDEGRTPLLFDPLVRGDGAPLPLAAVILLRAGAGPPHLAEVAGATAVRDLFSLAFRLPTDASRAASFSLVAKLVDRVPVLDLHRPLTVESLPSVVELIADHVLA